jgi:hypothetical protein
MDKTSALAIKLRQWKGSRSESKATRSRRLLAVAEGRQTIEGTQELTGRRARRAERRARKGRHGGPHVRRLRAKVAKADRLEYITTDGLVWVVLFNADRGESLSSTCLRYVLMHYIFTDSEIEGRELADSNKDVEEIDVGGS